MNWFRKAKRDDPLAGYSDVDARDRAVLSALVSNGADLGRPREVLHYLYFPEESTAGECSKELTDRWTVDVRPAAEGPEWLVLATRAGLVLTPQEVQSARNTFEAVTARFGGTYDGWEASV